MQDSGQALLAVYQKGLRKGKGKGKDKSAPSSPKGLGKGKNVRCLNCGKEGHPTDACKLPRVAAWDRPCFVCGKKGHQAAYCPDKSKGVNAVQEEQPPGLLMVDS